MSRVGLKPIAVPDRVDVAVDAGSLRIKGPKGQMITPIPPGISCKVADKEVRFERDSDSGPARALHGLARALAANAIHGVAQGFEKRLEIVGVGYRAALQGRKVQLNIGYSHPVDFAIPAGIDILVEETTKLVVKGIDRQQVGQVAAQLRALRAPDAYKGKGIRYAGETIKLKAGKTGSK